MTVMTMHDAQTPPDPKPEGADVRSVVITDSAGRRLKIREPNILEESRLVRTMGEATTNAAYMTGYVMPAVLVVEIDGEEMPFPTTPREVEAAIKRLGRAGMSAVLAHITTEAGQRADEAQEIKNSDGTPGSAKPAG